MIQRLAKALGAGSQLKKRQRFDQFVESVPYQKLSGPVLRHSTPLSLIGSACVRERRRQIVAIQMPSKAWLDRKGPEMERKATAVWRGDVRSGRGSLSTESSSLHEAQYSFGTRFENGVGTNPEELLAAAHAGCFAMAVSSQLGKIGLRPERLEATATITFQKVGEHFAITKSHLDLLAQVSGASQARFDAAVNAAQTGCPVSRLFKAEISVTARLEVTV